MTVSTEQHTKQSDPLAVASDLKEICDRFDRLHPGKSIKTRVVTGMKRDGCDGRLTKASPRGGKFGTHYTFKVKDNAGKTHCLSGYTNDFDTVRPEEGGIIVATHNKKVIVVL